MNAILLQSNRDGGGLSLAVSREFTMQAVGLVASVSAPGTCACR